MSSQLLCFLCAGSGDANYSDSSEHGYTTQTCHRCHGRGFISAFHDSLDVIHYAINRSEHYRKRLLSQRIERKRLEAIAVQAIEKKITRQ